VPVHDDRKHFEFLVLEAAQAGLSWSIVLKKREGYRRAFSQFDPKKVARYTEKRIQKLTLDPAIIRNRMKIEAAVRNARALLTIQEEFGSFDAYCWRFVDGRPKFNRWKAMREIPATSSEADAFSKDLKHRGFSFVGPTVVYAHMQAVGMVNDHLVGCFRYREIRRLDSVSERADLPARSRSRTTLSEPLGAMDGVLPDAITAPANVAKRPVLFADLNQTNEHVFPAQAETLVQSVCDCFVKGTLLVHGSPSIERELDKNAIFRSLNAQEAGIKDEILGWMLRDDLEAIVLRGLQDLNLCVINHFSDGPAVVASLTLCKIDSSEWHDRSPLRY
jgi:DNA-3-methyladenine glycosylase I